MNKPLTVIVVGIVGVAVVGIVGLSGLAAGVFWSGEIRSIVNRFAPAPVATSSADAAHDRLWTCGMHPQVIQAEPGLCPICHMDLTPLDVDAPASEHPPASAPGTPPSADEPPRSGERKVRYWWDPMLSPPYISDKPGVSPMGMELVPVYEDELPAGGMAVVIDPVVVQNMGVRFATVTEAPLRRTIRVVGYLAESQPLTRDINLRISGWIRRLHADTEGVLVQAGDPLFDLYSPDLRVAIEELITARRSLHALDSRMDDESRHLAGLLHESAVRKLELWGLPVAQIDALATLESAPDEITFVSPISGYITEKPIVEGAAVMAGDRVLRIVDHSTMWVEAQVFEKDLPFISLGQEVSASIASRPGASVAGEVVFIRPSVDPASRTVLVRLAIPNPDLSLRPGMYATVRIEAQLEERAVLVPREAIIDTGERQIAFVASGVGRFEPRLVEIGHAADGGMVQVLTGLAPGDPIVVSGQFLLDSESRLREAIQKFLRENRALASGESASAPTGATQIKTEAPHDTHDTGDPMNTPVADGAIVPVPEVDAVFAAYLRFADALGAPQASDEPVDAAPLVAASGRLREAMRGTPSETLAANLAAAADAMQSDSIDQQRITFKNASSAIIALVDARPPTSDVGDRLFVVHCPMAPGSWLQASDVISNPYYATSMKRCGEVLREIALNGPGDLP